jgi:DNA-binding protein H-NS
MTTYKELQAEIKEMQQRAEELRRNELSTTIADIKAKMEEYGITLADLDSKKKYKAGQGTVEPKYRNKGTGETWSGRGKPPRWIAGQNREDFSI